LLGGLLVVGLYIIECELNPLANILPVCKADGTHKLYAMIPICAFVIYYGGTSLLLTPILYVDISLGSILFGSYVTNELA
jgi:hypothetical protein